MSQVMVRVTRAFAAALSTCVLLVPVAWPQAWPVKPIHVVIPFPPGITDTMVRVLQPGMQQDLGQPMVIENRPGANASIGAEYVARSAPDGYTILVSSSAIVASPIMSGARFDTLKDFTPITIFHRTNMAIVARSSLPVNSIPGLIDYAKRNPGKLSYSTGGVGSTTQLETEFFKLLAGVDITHVPYKAFAAQAQAVASQEVDLTFIALSAVRPLLNAGKVKVLATYDGKRNPRLPGVPELTEFVPQFKKAPTFLGAFGPAGLSQPVLQRLNSAFVKQLKAGLLEKLDAETEVIANSPEEFAIALRQDVETTIKMAAAARAAGVKFE